MNKAIWAEIHCHTTESDGSMTPEEIVRLARARRLAALSVTDHNTFRGSSLAARISRLLGGPMILYGNEVRTEYGDVLVYCPHPHPTAPRSLTHLRDWARQNGCILVAAHPYHPVRSSIGRRIHDLIDYFDAIEVWNSRGLPPFNAPAIRLARKTGKPATSGSDAHVPRELATSPITLPDHPHEPEDIIEWIAKGKVKPTLGLPHPLAIPQALAWAIQKRLKDTKKP